MATPPHWHHTHTDLVEECVISFTRCYVIAVPGVAPLAALACAGGETYETCVAAEACDGKECVTIVCAWCACVCVCVRVRGAVLECEGWGDHGKHA